MAEYVVYSLDLHGHTGTDHKAALIVELRNRYPDLERILDEDGTGNEETSILTGDWVIRFSVRHPEILFILDMTNTSSGDSCPDNMSRIYIKSGKSYEVYPDLIWPEFDQSKLE